MKGMAACGLVVLVLHTSLCAVAVDGLSNAKPTGADPTSPPPRQLPEETRVVVQVHVNRLLASCLGRSQFLPMLGDFRNDFRLGLGFDPVTSVDSIVFSFPNLNEISSAFVRLEGRFRPEHVRFVLAENAAERIEYADSEIFRTDLDAELLQPFGIPSPGRTCFFCCLDSSTLLISYGDIRPLIEVLRGDKAEHPFAAVPAPDKDPSVFLQGEISPDAKVIRESAVDFDDMTFLEGRIKCRIARGIEFASDVVWKNLREAVEAEQGFNDVGTQFLGMMRVFSGRQGGRFLLEACESAQMNRDGKHLRIELYLPECWFHGLLDGGEVTYTNADGAVNDRDEAENVLYMTRRSDGTTEMVECNLNGRMRSRCAIKTERRTTITNEFFDDQGEPRLQDEGYARSVVHRDGEYTMYDASYYGVNGEPLDWHILVDEILPDSQALEIGLEVGDELATFGERPIRFIEEFNEAKRQQEKPMEIRVLRNGRGLTFTVQPGQLGVRLRNAFEESRDADKHLANGDSWYETGDYDRAAQYYDKAILLAPDCGGAYLRRAVLWSAKQRYEEAIADCSCAIKLDPDNVSAYDVRGSTFCEMREYEKAAEDFSKTIELSPEDVAGFWARGYAWRAKREYAKAIADYNEALRIAPDYARSYYERGCVWLEKGDIKEAIADYTEAIRIAPAYAEAYNDRAWLRATCGVAKYRSGKLALQDAHRALRYGKVKAAWLDTLAAAYAESGDFSKAVKWQRRALFENENGADDQGMYVRLELYRAGKPFRETDH